MRSEATGCVMSIQPALWRSRTWLLARTARKYTSTPSNHFIPAKNFWCGTAMNLPSAATTLHWPNWLLIIQVCTCQVCEGHLKKVQVTEFLYRSSELAFLSDTSPARSLNQSVNQLTCSFVLLFKNYSVTPTALLWREQHKGDDRSPESREGLSPAIAALFGKDDTNFETLDSISVSLFPLATESRLVSLFWHTKQPASIHKHKGCTCQRRNRMHAPKHSFTRTRAHTRGRLRCWQHSGTTPLFIWLLRRKRVRKHSSVTTWTSWQDDPLTDWYLTECWLFVC